MSSRDIDIDKAENSEEICFRISKPRPSKLFNLFEVIQKLLQEEKNQQVKTFLEILLISKSIKLNTRHLLNLFILSPSLQNLKRSRQKIILASLITLIKNSKFNLLMLKIT